MADTPETSAHTSIKERIKPTIDLERAVREQIEQNALQRFDLPLKPLAKLEGSVKQEIQNGVLFSHDDYLELVDYTGRIIHPKKRGAIPANTPPILDRLGIDLDEWLENTNQFEKNYWSHSWYKKETLDKTG